MNGVHDMGGMQGYGPVMPEHDEPWFHHQWERRALALTLAMGATRQWNIDQSRSMRETMPQARYLASSYYEIWIDGLQRLLLERELVSAAELASGHAEPSRANVVTAAKAASVSSALSSAPIVALRAERVPAALASGNPTSRKAEGKPSFAIGDAVRTREINPRTHTRLPRYCRGKRGTIVLSHGAHVFPDTNALASGESPQWLYTVRFAAAELWDADTTASAVHVDCWESYLEATA